MLYSSQSNFLNNAEIKARFCDPKQVLGYA